MRPGHSVGLRHTNSLSLSTVQCVYDPVPRANPYLGGHNTAHINGSS
jgi:hypothetical protein